MALASRQRATVAPLHGLPCSIGKVYAHVANDSDELAELNVILYEEGNTQRQVYDILTGEGELPFTIGFQSINKHRGKNCRCFQHEPLAFCRECKRDLPSCVCDSAA